jgi:transcriptional regulator with XRE-family HTH domain
LDLIGSIFTLQCGRESGAFELGMSQLKLAAALGITFQHLYKYEKVRIRISASRLYSFSNALGVPVTFFFEGLAEAGVKPQKPKRSKDQQR